MDRYLKIALAKGRLAGQAAVLFEGLGFDCSFIKSDSRKLIARDHKNRMEFILVKPNDVGKYVEQGAVDMGVVGKDSLVEQRPDVYEVLDLGIGKCWMVLAGKPQIKDIYKDITKVVATKYPATTLRYFREKGESVQVVKLDGSIELAPLVGLSDVILDLVETGKTLNENGLVVLEKIFPVSARLVVNRVSLKMENEKITGILKQLRDILRKAG